MRAVKVFQQEQRFRTSGGLAVQDITEEVAAAVRESEITDGIACVYAPHTTCCIRVNEFESGFLEDFTTLLRRLVPAEGHYYAHDDWDRRTENICPEDMDVGNGHARRTVPRNLAARALPRARPRARPPLDRPGRRELASSQTASARGR